MGFNPANYEDVDTRIHKFFEKFPEGRIETELVQTAAAKGERWIVKAFVYRPGEERPVGTGYAFEVDGVGNVNTTSGLENCETSAVGRALANAGLSAKGQRASRQEMEKVQRSSAEARPAQPSSKTRREVSAETVGESPESVGSNASTGEPKPVLPSAGSPPRTGEGGSDSPPSDRSTTPASPEPSSPAKSGGGSSVGEVGGIPPATDLVEAYGKSKVLVTARNIAKANGAPVPTSTDDIDDDLAKLVGKHFERVDA